MTDARLSIIMEIGLLGLVAIVAGVMAGLSIHNKDASGAAAWSALLMAIVNTIKENRQSRTIDRMGQSLANAPPSEPPAPNPEGPKS